MFSCSTSTLTLGARWGATTETLSPPLLKPHPGSRGGLVGHPLEATGYKGYNHWIWGRSPKRLDWGCGGYKTGRKTRKPSAGIFTMSIVLQLFSYFLVTIEPYWIITSYNHHRNRSEVSFIKNSLGYYQCWLLSVRTNQPLVNLPSWSIYIACAWSQR